MENNDISLHTKIVTVFETVDQDGNKITKKYTSTAGRFLLTNVLQKNYIIKFEIINKLLNQKHVY